MRDNERKREKEGRLFVKRLSQKLSAASRKTGDKANISKHKPKPVITPFHNLPHSNTAHKTRECVSIVPHKTNAVIKLHWMKRLTFPRGSRWRAALLAQKISLLSYSLLYHYNIYNSSVTLEQKREGKFGENVYLKLTFKKRLQYILKECIM